MSDDELLQLVGKPYTKDNARKMIYGGRIDSRGIIVEVITQKKDKSFLKKCKSIFSIFQVIFLKFFLDAEILIDSVEDNRKGREVYKKLRHIKNKDHVLVTSITVLGEIILVCMRDNRLDDLKNIIDMIAELGMTYYVPNNLLRDCCKCVDKLDKYNKTGSTDRTHLAYSLNYDDDYFITNDNEVLKLKIENIKCNKKCDKNNCTSNKIITPKDLKKIL